MVWWGVWVKWCFISFLWYNSSGGAWIHSSMLCFQAAIYFSEPFQSVLWVSLPQWCFVFCLSWFSFTSPIPAGVISLDSSGNINPQNSDVHREGARLILLCRESCWVEFVVGIQQGMQITQSVPLQCWMLQDIFENPFQCSFCQGILILPSAECLLKLTRVSLILMRDWHAV